MFDQLLQQDSSCLPVEIHDSLLPLQVLRPDANGKHNYYEKGINATWVENYISCLKEYDDLPITACAENENSANNMFAAFDLYPENEKDYVAIREKNFLSLREYFRDYSRSNQSLNDYMRLLNVMRFNVKYRLKGGWVRLFSQMNSHIFTTVAFRDRYTDKQVAEAARMLIRRLNRAIWRNSDYQPGKYLKGYAVLEPHTRRKGHVGYLHVHFVFDFNECVPTPEFLFNILAKQIEKIRSKRKTKREPQGRQMIEVNSIDTRLVTGRRGLAMYVTKCIKGRQWGSAANIMLVGDKGLAGTLPSRNG
jgi:hypothetical protein